MRSDEAIAVGDLTMRSYLTVYDDVGDYEAVLRRVSHRARSADVLVADLHGEIVGTVTYVRGPGPYAEGDPPDPEAAWIRMLAVAPEAMGRGIGLALAEECIDRARADGRRRILLNTGDAQVAARRLYERLGFERRPDLDELIDEDLWMRTYSLELR